MKTILAVAAILATTTALPALAAPDYVTIVLDKTVNRTPDQTWAKIGPYCAIKDWLKLPCTIASGDGNSVGTVRDLKRESDTLVEVMVAKTPHSYTYTQPATTILYHGTLAVEPLDGGRHTRIVYTVFYDQASMTPKDRTANRAYRVKRFTEGLEAMKAMAEAR